ncbi:MAG: leucine-rich repeat protein, partial [Clostridia bacterium]|nr:leucine-rich repeat protein [Clostridia bacterium]
MCLSAGVAALFSACGEDGGNSAIPENVISVSTYSGTYPEADHSFEAVDEVVREIYISDAKGDYELALPYPASAYTVTFEGCHELTDITVDGQNARIESFSVRNCEKLKTVTFRTRGGEVADMEFVNTGDLSEILLPEGTRTINGLRLDSCDGKTKIDFALSLSAVGSVETFYCSDLREVAFSGGAESVGSLTVFGSDAVKCTISGLVGKFDNLQIRDFAALKTAFVSVTSENIVNCEFINCSVLNAVVIGGGVEHIG